MGISSIGLGVLPTLYSFRDPHSPQPPYELPRSLPESQGVSSQGILKFLDAIKGSGQEFHSLMIMRHGQVISEGWWWPYSHEHKQQLYSLSKSFTGTAIGLAVSEGLLTIDDPVVKFFPDMLPPKISEHLAAMKVRHLLSMSVGHSRDAILLLEASPPGTPWEKTFLAQPVVFAPGSQFMYNSGASFMLSAIIKRVTGMSAQDYLMPRLYQPLGISNVSWGANFEGINMGASHLRMPTEGIARFGQLYLQQGKWKGKQVISRDWVQEASSRQMVNGHNDSSWGYGYGFQFWLNPPGGYRADGAFGQYSMILTAQDAVVAITSESINTKETMQIVWDVLVPEFKEGTLPINKTGNDTLQFQLSTLHYQPPSVAADSPISSKISGKKFHLEANSFNAESVSFSFEGSHCIFVLKEKSKPEIKITNGMGYWIRKGNYKPSAHSLFSLRRIDFDSIVAASATWADEKTLLLSWRYIE
ncbi:MAG: serine hydrolase, partial [Bacteroidota bacterium]|nr:serine hydrolase [Bacteroidota bacterium]